MAAVVYRHRRRHLNRNRIFRDRTNPLEVFDDLELYRRFRFRRIDIFRIVHAVRDDITYDVYRRSTLSPELQVLAALRFYATGSFQNVVGDTINVHQSTVSRAIRRVSLSLQGKLNTWIFFPGANEMTHIKDSFYNMAGFPGVVGCVDGTHVRIQAPREEEYNFVNRKGYHSINVHAVCDSKLRLLNCVVKWPGSVHDARMLTESRMYADFENRVLDGIILGDSAYPLRTWLMTPLRNPQTRQEERYNFSHASTRNCIERCFGVIKRRFHCLHSELRYPPKRCCSVISAVLVLHNMAVEFGTPLVDDYDVDDDGGDNVHNIPEPRNAKLKRDRIIQTFFAQ